MSHINNNRPQVQVLLPVYNEVLSLPLVLEEWDKMFKENSIKYNFVICEDGSDDGTKELLNELKNKFHIVLNQKLYRRGYGKAFYDGLMDVVSDYVLFIDSDGQCDPQDFPKLWKNRIKSGVITGRRTNRQDTKLRIVYSRLFYIYYWILFRGNIMDPSTCFMLADSSIIKEHINSISLAQESFRWGITSTCLKNKIPIKEIPIHHRKRLFGKTRVFSTSKVFGVVWRGFTGLLKIRVKTKPNT